LRSDSLPGPCVQIVLGIQSDSTGQRYQRKRKEEAEDYVYNNQSSIGCGDESAEEHLAQAVQIWVLHWPRPKAGGVLGLWFPWLVTSEVLHYGYALIMLVGIWVLRKGFVGTSRKWWTVALIIQFWHHIEHLLLIGQATFHHNLFGSPVPASILQLFVPRVELHLFYNTVVFIPMIIGMYYHLFPAKQDAERALCSCAWQSSPAYTS